MIPKNIEVEHIIEALNFIKNNPWPSKHNSVNYNFVYKKQKNQPSPPKYVIKIANKFVNGKELSTQGFNAWEAVVYILKLNHRDFEIYKNNVLMNKKG